MKNCDIQFYTPVMMQATQHWAAFLDCPPNSVYLIWLKVQVMEDLPSMDRLSLPQDEHTSQLVI